LDNWQHIRSERTRAFLDSIGCWIPCALEIFKLNWTDIKNKKNTTNWLLQV